MSVTICGFDLCLRGDVLWFRTCALQELYRQLQYCAGIANLLFDCLTRLSGCLRRFSTFVTKGVGYEIRAAWLCGSLQSCMANCRAVSSLQCCVVHCGVSCLTASLCDSLHCCVIHCRTAWLNAGLCDSLYCCVVHWRAVWLTAELCDSLQDCKAHCRTAWLTAGLVTHCSSA